MIAVLAMQTTAFQAPALKAPMRAVGASMFAEGDIGVTLPLGVYDPLGLIETKDMRRFEIMEIKHGRAAMLGFLHVVLIHAGVRLPGYLSFVNGAQRTGRSFLFNLLLLRARRALSSALAGLCTP
jgi:hypothetical protein